MVGEFHHALEEPGALAIAFRPVVGLDLEAVEVPLVGCKPVPPVMQAIDDEVAGLGRTAKDQMQLAATAATP
jgi:hypothetical protein